MKKRSTTPMDRMVVMLISAAVGAAATGVGYFAYLYNVNAAGWAMAFGAIGFISMVGGLALSKRAEAWVNWLAIVLTGFGLGMLMISIGGMLIAYPTLQR